MLSSVLDEADVTLDFIAGFIFMVGPGSFTGIRTGLSMLKGMAFGRSTSGVELSSLRVLSAPFFGLNKKVCPILDARMNQIYTALFDSSGRMLQPDHAAFPGEFSECLDGDIILVGNDAPNFEKSMITGKVTSFEYKSPTSEQIIEHSIIEGTAMFEKGGFIPVSEMKPLYLRKSYAEIKSSITA